MTDAKPSLKAKALREFVRFATMFAYLWVMFLLLQLHQYVILAQRHIPFEQYGVGFINALVLAKVMLVADDLRLGEWRGRQRLPLIYPVLLRSALFALVFIVFDVIEKMLLGMVRGKSLGDSIESFGGGGTPRRAPRRNHCRPIPCSFLRLCRGEPPDGAGGARKNTLYPWAKTSRRQYRPTVCIELAAVCSSEK